MAVILANCELSLRVRPHQWVRDEHGTPVAPAEAVHARGPFPGFAREDRDMQVWILRGDMGLWPIETGDEVTDGSRTWVVRSATEHTIPGYPAVDYVSIIAVLNPPKVP